jgi:hypothetical protein
MSETHEENEPEAIRRALARKPADRFDSARQAAEELDRAVRG